MLVWGIFQFLITGIVCFYEFKNISSVIFMRATYPILVSNCAKTELKE